MSKKDNIFLASFLLLWTIYVLYPLPLVRPSGISSDGLYYFHMARNIVKNFELGWEGSFTCPLYSIFMALLYPITGDIALSGVWVTKIFAVIFPLSVFVLARELFDFKIAFFSTVLSCFHPHIIYIAKNNGYVEPEMLYIVLQIFSFYLIWLSFKNSKIWVSVFAGLFSALAYLTRSEGLLVFFLAMTSLLFFVKSDLKLKLKISGITLIVFFITALPYLIFLKDIYGGWVTSPKFSNVVIGGDQYFYDVKKRRPVPEFWELTDKGKFAWQEKKGVRDLILYLLKDPKTQWENYKTGLKYIVTMKIPNASGMDFYPSVYPWYFFIPALIFLLLSLKNYEERLKSVFLFSFFPMLFVLNILSGIWWKYLVAYSPFIIILSVKFFDKLSEKINFKYLTSIITAGIFIFSFYSYHKTQNKPSSYISMKGNYVSAQKNAGEWAKKFLKPEANYMMSWSKLMYFLEGKWILLPMTDYNRLYWYSKKNKVDYLVLEGENKEEENLIVSEISTIPFFEIAGIYREKIQDKTGKFEPIDYSAIFIKIK
ncbi:MAG: glycosyltransferase family 39 protein [Proteobacteria bacterium]|nr:glycosyltransferase family 39 protein [Pseudomonadota bacterium]